jgi:aspartyl-tRNA(Asn)/glutamyl-tRNA(Gln) amidotransferase subunit C
VARNHYFCLMEVNDAMINKLASLARLRFSEAERESIKNDLQKMISFVQKMDEVNTGDTEPLQHISGRKNVWRQDEVQGSCSQQQALQNAPRHNNRFFMVPTIIQKQ